MNDFGRKVSAPHDLTDEQRAILALFNEVDRLRAEVKQMKSGNTLKVVNGKRGAKT